MRTRRCSVVVAVSALTVLAACAVAPPSPPEFDRAQADGDRLPPTITELAEVVPDSVRYVAPWQSTSVYVAHSTQREGSTCLVVLQHDDPSQWASSCNWSGGAVTLSFAGHQYRISEGPDGSSDQRPTQLTEGIYAIS